MCLVTAELSLTLGSDVEIYWGIDCTLAALTRLCLLMRRKRLWQQLLLECTRLCKPKLNLLQPNLRLRKNRLWQQLLLECSRPIPVQPSCAVRMLSYIGCQWFMHAYIAYVMLHIHVCMSWCDMTPHFTISVVIDQMHQATLACANAFANALHVPCMCAHWPTQHSWPAQGAQHSQH